MASGFPSALDNFATNHLEGEAIQEETDNDHADAINKIEATLGQNPQGAESTLGNRVAAVEGAPFITTTTSTKLTAETTLGSVILRDTAANRPAASIAGRLFHATDTRVLSRDNGSSWDDLGILMPTTGKPDYTVTNVTTDRTYDANSYTMDELADVLGTLIADLTTAGILT